MLLCTWIVCILLFTCEQYWPNCCFVPCHYIWISILMLFASNVHQLRQYPSCILFFQISGCKIMCIVHVNITNIVVHTWTVLPCPLFYMILLYLDFDWCSPMVYMICILKYHGDEQSQDVVCWLYFLEEDFKIVQCCRENTKLLTSLWLHGIALYWWDVWQR